MLSCKKIFFVFIALSVFIVSCKKKEKNTTPPASTNNVVAGAYSNHQADYYYLDNGTTVTKDSMVFVSYFQSPPTGTASIVKVNAGNVYLNGTALNYSSGTYQNGGPLKVSGLITWSVSGSGTVTAFVHSYTASHPSYTGANLLPDTCIKSSGININVSGVSNVSSVSVGLYQGSSSLMKQLFSFNGNVNFTSTELASFSTMQPITIMVDCGKYKTEILGGVEHGFSNNLVYNKISYLK